MRVLILHDAVADDARADERDVLDQVAAVAACLRAAGQEEARLAVDLDLAAAGRAIRAWAPDVVFNLVESLDRSGRLAHLVPALLDHLRVPYTGSPTEALFLSSGKLTAKRVLRAADVATPECWTVADLDGGAAPQGPVVVKSEWEHGSVGIGEHSVLDGSDAAALRRRLLDAAPALGGSAFAEAYVDGREWNVAVLEEAGAPRVLPPAEILFVDWPAHRPRILGFDAKWTSDAAEYRDTPRTFRHDPADAVLLQRVIDVALRTWHAFGLRGYARVDLRVDERGTPWVVDVNANPCLTPDAGFCAALAEAGLTLGDAVARVVAGALAGRA